MRVVSNTSPICNLAILDRLGLLRQKFGRIFIPAAVRRELARLAHDPARRLIEEAIREQHIMVEDVADRQLLPVLRTRVHEGEAEAIELARQTSAGLLLIDELAGRKLAADIGVPYTGLLGILMEEKVAGRISSLKAELGKLRRECRFFIAAALEAKVLRDVGE